MGVISKIQARQILDSRGNPTIEVDLFTNAGGFGRATVPSGASTGVHEAMELRDMDSKMFLGKGVLKAVNNVNTMLNQELNGMNVFMQTEVDNRMIAIDDSENKSNLGANAVLGVSIACLKAAAHETGISLFRYIGGLSSTTMPVPMLNIINGGAHANNSLDFQEFMIVPIGAKSFSSAIRMSAEIFHNLKGLLHRQGHNISVGDEGGFAPNLKSNNEAIELILQATKNAGYKAGKDICVALDVAASELYDIKSKQYHLAKSKKKNLSSSDLISLYEDIINNYPVISIEDGLAEDDWDGWQQLTKRLGNKVQLVGDDLFVTNPKRIKQGIERKVANSVLIKVNQIGTLTETIEAVNLAKENAYTAVISHRSGETEDSFIADLSVGLAAGQIKTGSLSRSERIAKYNQLLRIEEELGISAKYPENPSGMLHKQN